MRIVRSNELVIVDSVIHIKPFTRYVVADFSAMRLIDECDDGRWAWSSFNPYERRYGGQDLNGKSICVYRHNAIGDQLILSAIPAELKRRFPGATIHMYAHPQVLPVWDGNPHLGGSAMSIPIPFDAVNPNNPFSYDYHAFFEGMLENNSECDQQCCYDDFFGVIGMKDVPDCAKKPSVIPLPRDHAFSNHYHLNRMVKTVVYPISPYNRNRCYPYENSRKMLPMLEKALPDHVILVVGKTESDDYKIALEDCGTRVIDLVNKSRSIRDLIPVVERASLVITPDTSFLHMAAAFPGVPIVSLWGLFHPNDRAKYYTNDHPIFKCDVCPHAPCRDHNFILPTEKCKDAEGAPAEHKIQWCQCLKAITPEEVVVKAKEIIG